MKKTSLVVLASLGLVMTGTAFAAGNFSQTCSNVSISGSVLSAVCKKADGRTNNTTKFDLGTKVGNINGALQWNSGAFQQSCTNMTVQGATLSATCKTMAGASVPTTLNLDENIANLNGVLSYVASCNGLNGFTNGASTITVAADGKTVSVAMGSRPTASGTCSGNTLTVNFPDDRSYNGTFDGTSIRWNNNTTWTKK